MSLLIGYIPNSQVTVSPKAWGKQVCCTTGSPPATDVKQPLPANDSDDHETDTVGESHWEGP